ncbi:MAG: T9SS type A sorting domain-containing protein [Bacteroidetes bacterium]|nr:T9SS type A sorting domain-containing protein [Bacteroidota bacterium]
MKNILQFSITVLLSMSVLTAAAQQWSDVGNPGFTNNILASNFSGLQYASRIAVYNNIPYMAYVNSNYDVDVMNYTGGNWSLLTSPGAGGNPTTAPISNVYIAFDATGNLYLAYMQVSIVYVKKFNGTTWSTVGGGPVISNFLASLAIDPVSNNPYVATINNGGTSKVTVRKFNGTSWVDVGLANFSAVTNRVRLTISSSGVPYITLRDGTSGTSFSVLKFDGANWIAVGISGIGLLGNPVDFTDIAVDGSGVPYIVSLNGTNNKASVLRYIGANWFTVGQADFSAGAALQPNLKFDNAGVLHIVYRDGANGDKTTVMKFNGTNWVGVGNAGLSGGGVYFPTLAFNSSNLPYVGFRDALDVGAKCTVLKLCTATTASITSTTPASICGSGTLTLLAAGTGTFRWYDGATNGAYVSTGLSFSTPSLITTTTYSVAAYDANGCSTARIPVTATVNTIPTIIATQPGGTCQGGTADIAATASVGTVSWYTTPTGGSPFATGIVSGSLVTTPVLNTTTTFYAEAVNNGCASTTRSAVQAIVNPTPATPTANEGSRCGSGTVSISVTAGAGTVQWFAASTGGSSLGTGTSFTTPSLTTTTTYYALLSNGCPALTRVPVAAIINAIPTVTSTTPATRCGTGTVTLTATLSDEGGINWFTAASGGSAVGTNSFTTPSLTATTTFFAEAVANGCSSVSRTPVVATIKPIPTITAPNVSRCGPGTVALTATSDGAMGWFAAASGGSALTTGGNFTTPSLTATTPYFIEATLNGCTTLTRTSVSAVVNPIPALPTITADNSNVAAPVLTSSSSSGNQWFRNDVSISGATANTFTITQEGTYKVQVTLLGCVGAMSAGQAFVITGVEGFEPNHVQLYPNPAADELILNLSGFEPKKPVGIVIVDLLGRQAKAVDGVGGEEVRIDIREITSGQYIAVMKQGNQQVAKLFVKKF